jgi:hypothetical protein
LNYLADLGVDVATAVRLVVITHWDDDHVAGIAEVVEQASTATVVCSAALNRKDIVEFVFAQERAKGPLGSGVDELRTVLRTCGARGEEIVWAKANLPLHPRPPGDAPSVVALSPSENAVARSVESLIEAATGAKSTVPRRYRAPEGPNGASVACFVRHGDFGALLGADLTNSKNPQTGWDAVLTYAKPPRLASIVKVPHHGSDGAHNDRMWDELLTEDVVALLTPWAKADGFLPTQNDLERLKSVSERLFLTAAPALKRIDKDPEVERLIRRLHGERLEELVGWGHIRARSTGGEEWSVELNGDATLVAA